MMRKVTVLVLVMAGVCMGQTTINRPPLTVDNSATRAPLRLTERATAPSAPTAGEIYLDDGTLAGSTLPLFRRYTGSAWENIGQPYDLDLTTWAGIAPHASWQDILDGTLTTPLNARTARTSMNALPVYHSDDYASINAAVTAIGATSAMLYVTTSETLTANLTIPATCAVRIDKGGMIVKASTYTLTINGSFEAGLYQCFSGFTTVTLKQVKEVYPQWFGAIADDGLDDTAAIQAAIDAAKARDRGGVVLVPEGVYNVSSLHITGIVLGKSVWLKGVGWPQTRIIITGDVGIDLTLSSFCRVSHLWLDIGSPFTSRVGILLARAGGGSCNGNRIDHCWLGNNGANFLTAHIYGVGCENTTIEANRFSNAGLCDATHLRLGVFLSGWDYYDVNSPTLGEIDTGGQSTLFNRVTGNHFYWPSTTGEPVGILIGSNATCTSIIGNDFGGTMLGAVRITDFAAVGMMSVNVWDNKCETSGVGAAASAGVYVDSDGSGRVNYLSIQGNHYSGAINSPLVAEASTVLLDNFSYRDNTSSLNATMVLPKLRYAQVSSLTTDLTITQMAGSDWWASDLVGVAGYFGVTPAKGVPPFVTSGGTTLRLYTPSGVQERLVGTAASPNLFASNSLFALGSTLTNMLEFGLYGGGAYGAWIQGTSTNHNGTSYPIYLNPLGGAVYAGGHFAVTGDLTITGDDIFATTNTLGALWVGDGTNYNPVVMSGDATIAANGAVTIAADAVESSMIGDYQAVRLLGVADANMTAAAAKTTVYTVPAGKSAIVTMVIIRNPTASLAAGVDYDLGDGAAADTWKTTIDLSTMTATTDCIIIQPPTAKFTVFDATDAFGIKPATGSTATASATVYAYGIEF